ncbi:MAG TPA: hypothetical protein VHE34_09305 [Puia sp.]|uniref:hypothetical protein n=1 Tax=Puia sp. TaxID=2045100 RepID=UPI002B644D17|nr:hypothetical protein [Puia sp.]HVU95410.1 hypothetical protein [Puia sp.]
MALPSLPKQSKRRLLYLSYCLAGSIALILSLAFLSEAAKNSSNAFIRMAPSHVAMPTQIRDLHSASWYLAGGTPTRFYLANRSAPALLMEIGMQLKDSTLHYLSLISLSNRISKSLKITVDSPNISLAEGVSPLLAGGRVGDTTLHRLANHAYFGLAAPLSPSTQILRATDARLKQNILLKQTPDTLMSKGPILEKQVDGIFCTDGYLHAQPDSNRLIYIYSYRNQWICLDTNLNIRYKARTIDTISRVKFSVGSIPSQHALTLSSPPTFVNQQSCINGNYLFVHSALRADNDERDLYEMSSPIDVYSLIDGKYLLSFYLPDYRKHKIRDFRVFGNTLVALYDHYAYTYTLFFPPKLQK